MLESDTKNRVKRVQALCFSLIFAFSSLVVGVAAQADGFTVYSGDKWNGTSRGTSPYGKYEITHTTEWHGPGNNYQLGGVHSINSIKYTKSDASFNLVGKACVCTGNNQNCLKFTGTRMAYLGKAYNANFTTMGFNNFGGCGQYGRTINGRIAGYIRLRSSRGHCVQSKNNPASGGALHYWASCGTGDNQQRRVISYHNHELKFASDTSLCLATGSSVSSGSSVKLERCSSVSSSRKQWTYDHTNHKIMLMADTSYCLATSAKSDGAGIVVEKCSVGSKARWQITWSQDH